MDDRKWIPWTGEQTTLVIEKAAEGLSASRISALLGCAKSRNAVIGLCHRLGVKLTSRFRVSAERQEMPVVSRTLHPRPAPKIARKSAKPKPPPVDLKEFFDDEPALLRGKIIRYGAAKAHAELKPNSCRWPFGDPKEDDFRFCMEPTATFPYCPMHASSGRDPRYGIRNLPNDRRNPRTSRNESVRSSSDH